jgi:geranylgeranyl reductase family protein
MTAPHPVDVLVIGLGPAGAAAAAVAARAGLQVLCLERRSQIGVPVQCAEYVPLPLAKHTRIDGVLQQRIMGMTSVLPSGMEEHSDFPGLMVDRAAFDQALAAEAQRQGAQCLLDARVLAVDAAHNMTRVRQGRTETTIGYRLLIAADGPHSTVARSLGLTPLDTIWTRQYTVALRQSCARTEVWLSADYPGGYAWLFPKGEVANLGVGMDKRMGRDMKQPLDALHRRLMDAGRVGADILARTGGAIPVGGLRDPLVAGRVLFVGDAAGLTHPITGAGIAAALSSGERAGEAAAVFLRGGDPWALRLFEEEIRDQFGPSLARAVARRRRMYRDRSPDLDAPYRAGWVAYPEYFERDVAGELQG